MGNSHFTGREALAQFLATPVCISPAVIAICITAACTI
jgi:hypothetical protein